MALNAIQGLPGDGKSYTAVNELMADYLRTTERPIYTNLPLELEWYLPWLTKNVARQEQMRARIHFLRDELVEWVNPENPEDKEKRNQLREFWYFTEPNSVIFLDEVADIFSSLDKGDVAGRKVLQSYINHHRHYKDDLYFFCQDRDDLDVQVRRKIQYVWVVRNSLKENMIDYWAFRGLRWPVQFFFMRCYLGQHVLGKNAAETIKFIPQDTRLIFPRSRCFKNYQSFSHAHPLPGKKTASETSTSGDFEPSLWKRSRSFLARSYKPIGVVLAIFVFLICIVHALYRMAGLSSSDIAKMAGVRSKRPAAVAVVSNSVSAAVAQTNSLVLLTNAPVLAVTNSAAVAPEMFLMATNEKLITNKGEYEIGDTWRGRIIARIYLDGVLFRNGDKLRFKDVFFQR